MNLIEQAAKRLEELKQAGAELPEGQRSDHLRAPIHATPTPEGVMRAFEAHRPSAIPIPEPLEVTSRRVRMSGPRTIDRVASNWISRP